MPPFLTSDNAATTLRVRLTPKAARNALGGIYTDEKGQDWLKATVTAVPEKGKANAALIELLAKTLKIRKTAITLISGDTDRHKTFKISEMLETERFSPLYPPSRSAGGGKVSECEHRGEGVTKTSVDSVFSAVQKTDPDLSRP